MNPWVAYVLGLLTLPALAGLVALYVFLTTWLDHRFGITYDLKFRRDVQGITDYTLRHDIWWERSWGPFFAGGWYRDNEMGRRRINRWIGLGGVDGPCFVVYRSVVLGKAPLRKVRRRSLSEIRGDKAT